jgi:hypothetical protein
MIRSPIVLLTSALAFGSVPVLAQDAAGPMSPSPSEKAWRSTDPPKSPEARAREVKKAAISAQKAASGGESLGSRGSPASGKSWDEMTPEEQDAARKRWLLNSGDFGTSVVGPPKGAPKSADKAPPLQQNSRTK